MAETLKKISQLQFGGTTYKIQDTELKTNFETTKAEFENVKIAFNKIKTDFVKIKALTENEYNALSEEEKNNGTFYAIYELTEE